MKEMRVPSDTIKFILSNLRKGERFSTNMPPIHTAFYELAQKRVFNSLFKEFIFDTSRMYPESEQVRTAFDRLTKSNLLVFINLEKYEVTEYLSKADPSELFTRGEIKLLKKAAKKFSCMLKVTTL